MDQDGESFQKSNPSHYKEANTATGAILLSIKDSWVTPSQCNAQSPESAMCDKWQHVFPEFSPIGAIRSRLPTSSAQYISSFNSSARSKAISKESHEMQPLIILLRHRSDYCLLWEELETALSSIYS